MYILLFLLWIALNGRVTLEIVLFGLVIAFGVNKFTQTYLEHTPKNDRQIFKNWYKVIKYIAVLLVEIVKSSVKVIKFVLSKNIEIEPQIVFFKVPFKSQFLKTVLANSITLTPGTITLNIEDDTFCVHALDYTLAEDFENSIFVKLLKEMEEK